MCFIRIAPLYSSIFTNWPWDYGKYVNFSADDAIYHMRLVHNTIQHFPYRVFFDPFTHFPFGNQIHFGPLFTLIIAGAALIIGLGNPSPELVNIVGAYIPVIMGVLCLIPVYLIAYKNSCKQAALISAFILTFLPGVFLQRSSLGFTDHHVAETLFSSLTGVFIIYALDKSKNFLWHCIFAGIFFGLFILTWPAALMFGAIFLIFLILQLLINHIKNRPTTYLLSLAMILYSIPIIMVIPYSLMNPKFELMYYSLTQPVILVSLAGIFVISYLTHLLCRYNQLTKNLYPIVISMIFILVFFSLQHAMPKLFTLIRDGCALLFEPSAGMKTISEVRPSILQYDSDKYTITRLWQYYFWALPLAIIGFVHLCYRAYKSTISKEVFLSIWTLFIILAAFAQNRFNYYLAINVAILGGCYAINPAINFLANLKPKNPLKLKLQKITIHTLFIIFMFLIVDPILMLLMDKLAPKGVVLSRELYNAYIWLKKHTPDPQGNIIHKDFNYASGYYPIPKDTGLPYKYPKSAYGIMAWWEIGHQITYIAERIPNTNPFQMGIVEKNNTIGAAPFFTSTDENQAVKNLKFTGSQYIFIDHKTATDIEGVGIWCNDTTGWTKYITIKTPLIPKNSKFNPSIDSEKFLQSMLNRLYYEDTNGLKHFRLIYESDGEYLVKVKRVILKPKLNINTKIINFKKYNNAFKTTSFINHGPLHNKEKTVLAYYARPPVKNFKIFEKVKGAVISGEVSKSMLDQTKISITLKLKTKFHRTFTYKQISNINNGQYKFIVPYPTTNMRGSNYSYDIKPTGSYEIKIGAKTSKVSVSEEDVMLGKNIKINIF